MGQLIQADRRATLTEIMTRYNRGMQHLWSYNTHNLEADEAEDPTGSHSSPLQIGKRGYNLQELTKIGQLKTGKNFAWWFDESLVFAQANFQIKFFSNVPVAMSHIWNM